MGPEWPLNMIDSTTKQCKQNLLHSPWCYWHLVISEQVCSSPMKPVLYLKNHQLRAVPQLLTVTYIYHLSVMVFSSIWCAMILWKSFRFWDYYTRCPTAWSLQFHSLSGWQNCSSTNSYGSSTGDRTSDLQCHSVWYPVLTNFLSYSGYQCCSWTNRILLDGFRLCVCQWNEPEFYATSYA